MPYFDEHAGLFSCESCEEIVPEEEVSEADDILVCHACWHENRCLNCGGDGEVHVRRDAHGNLDYLRGQRTNEMTRCNACGGRGHRF